MRTICALAFTGLLAGCSTTFYNPNITDPVVLERQRVIDQGYCTRVAVGAVPMPEIRHYQTGSQNYQISGTAQTFNSSGASSTSYYTGQAYSYPNAGEAFATGFANGANIGAAFKARKQQDEALHGCMYALGWTADEDAAPTAPSSVTREQEFTQWQATVQSFLKQNPQYQNDRERFDLLDTTVRRIAKESPDLTDEAVLNRAHIEVEAKYNAKKINVAQPHGSDEFFSQALKDAQRGDIKMQVRIAEAYLYGEGAPRDFDQAIYWAKKASAQGDSYATFMVSFAYSGTWFPDHKNQTLMIDFLQKAADQGYGMAQAMIASAFQSGSFGYSRNSAKAIEWYVKACNNNVPSAFTGLGTMHALGEGVPKNPVEAHKLFSRAEQLGDVDAAKYRAELEKFMTTAEIEQTKR